MGHKVVLGRFPWTFRFLFRAQAGNLDTHKQIVFSKHARTLLADTRHMSVCRAASSTSHNYYSLVLLRSQSPSRRHHTARRAQQLSTSRLHRFLPSIHILSCIVLSGLASFTVRERPSKRMGTQVPRRQSCIDPSEFVPSFLNVIWPTILAKRPSQRPHNSRRW